MAEVAACGFEVTLLLLLLLLVVERGGFGA